MVTINGFTVDAAISEDHAFDSDVTVHPVEEGADISDNIRARPITITLDCVVSDTPIADGSVIVEEGTLPTDETFNKLVAIRDARLPVTITTSRGTFENMALQSLSVPVTSKTGAALSFRVTFVQIRIVKNDLILTTIPRAKKRRNRGNRLTVTLGDTTYVPTPETAEQHATAIDDAQRALRGGDFAFDDGSGLEFQGADVGAR